MQGWSLSILQKLWKISLNYRYIKGGTKLQICTVARVWWRIQKVKNFRIWKLILSETSYIFVLWQKRNCEFFTNQSRKLVSILFIFYCTILLCGHLLRKKNTLNKVKIVYSVLQSLIYSWWTSLGGPTLITFSLQKPRKGNLCFSF